MRASLLFLLPLALGSLLVGCAAHEPTVARSTTAASAPAPAAPVVATTAGDHEVLALIEDFDDGARDTEFDPGDADAIRYCTADDGRVCWKEVVSPTRESEATARRLRALAAEERARSAAVREAEARECASLTVEDRDISPLARVRDIAWVHELREGRPDGRGVAGARTVGATILFVAVPGLTAEHLERAIACHLARSAALAFERPGFEGCPLALPDVEARVRVVPEGFAVDLRSRSPETAHAIWARAQRLTPAS